MKLGFIFDRGFDYYDGHYYATNLTQKFWKERYLPYFDDIVVVGRHLDAKQDPRGKLSQSDMEHVTFRCMPNRSRPKRMLTQAQEGRFIEQAIADCDAVICRNWWGTAQCRKLGKPYMMEVITCIWDGLWNHSAAGKVAAIPCYFLQRYAIAHAPYVLYVTQETLQKKYPTANMQIGVSDVYLTGTLSEEGLQKRLDRIRDTQHGILKIGTAAAVNVAFKGQRFVIEALARLKKQGNCSYRYEMAGGGDQSALRELARKNGVEDLVTFRGPIPHDQMLEWYDSLDLYVQPSLQEGLPRALVEAMSRGLPCFGTSTGGIPELISKEYVCDRRKNIPDQFVALLQNFTTEKMLQQSRRNWEESRKYDGRLLDRKRAGFMMDFIEYARIHQVTG